MFLKMSFEYKFLLWEVFFFLLTMTGCHLGETSNQQIYNESCQLLLRIPSLVFISFDFKLHNAALVNIMSSTCCIIVTGMVPFKILKNITHKTHCLWS